jgi:peptide/nickel transport system ATP-binding protein
MKPILEIKDLKIGFGDTVSPAVQQSSFDIPKGSITAIVGESGSGKSVTALSILQLLPAGSQVNGNILFSSDGISQTDLLQMNAKQIRQIRGNEISMIFQEPMTSLNPVFTCGEQVMEAILQHKTLSKEAARQQTISLFEQVELPDPTAMLKRYPHQLSGGQKQRVMIAMAMSCNPSLLIADEPTTALDVRVQKNILSLIQKLQQQHGMSVLLITHDLGLVADTADQVIVMYKGAIVEKEATLSVLSNPQHPYTQALLTCRPAANRKKDRLPVIADFMEPGNAPVLKEKYSIEPHLQETAVLSVDSLTVEYPGKKNLFGKNIPPFKAVDNVSFEVKENETVGLVGESGCGKTTLGRAILHLVQPSSGQIMLQGKNLNELSAGALRIVRRDLQIVFQDPYGSLNPRITIGDAIMEPLQVHRIFEKKKQRKEKVVELLEAVNLLPDHFDRYPHQFSGGQRQRICIARALALHPSFLVFDESVSALDVSIQAQVLNLVNDLKAKMKFTSIFISHDLSVVHYISDRIMVMRNGKIIESGTADEIYFNPQQAYTKELIDSIPGRR